VVAEGANDFNGLQLRVAQDNEGRVRAARKMSAFKMLMARAQQLGRCCGVKLGKVISMSENQPRFFAQWRCASRQMKSMDHAIETGEVDV